jgi:hypothetical protein
VSTAALRFRYSGTTTTTRSPLTMASWARCSAAEHSAPLSMERPGGMALSARGDGQRQRY